MLSEVKREHRATNKDTLDGWTSIILTLFSLILLVKTYSVYRTDTLGTVHDIPYCHRRNGIHRISRIRGSIDQRCLYG